MMRITGGEWRGRRLARPADPRVRPTGERVREAWMNLVRSALPGATVLDLFAGSGALGLEALSRGAAAVTFVEIGTESLLALRKNLETLGNPAAATVRRVDARRLVDSLEPGAFDLVFADPPWAMDHAAAIVSRFEAVPFADILVVEHPATVKLPGHETRRYGDTALTICRAP
ncbi:MAG: 16S rRNA (guanine(966)-N(2))-methyltransferase RsmD [Gemmatimonadota bacterium]|nr:16S rRNA (guanine(966)-N(2))-methyltransferase RsmD [Gemmatimonadota bacterium]